MAALLCIVASVALASSVAAQQDQGTAARIERVTRGLLPPTVIAGRPLPAWSLAERMSRYRVPAVSVAVIDGGRIAWARAWGVLAAGGPAADTATLFQAASISKPVAALAALRLVEQGRLSLDEDVNLRLRSWQVPEDRHTRSEKVTLRRILSHSAGLTVHGFRGYAAGERVPTLAQVLNGETPANSAPVRADTLPGSLWRYSGGGFTVAQLLMQDVTGRPFPELAKELVLSPLGMGRSTFEQPLPASLADNAATGHRSSGAPLPGMWHTYPEMAAAGLWTTPSDLARLAIEVQRTLDGAAGRVISAAMTRELLRRQAGSSGLGFSLEGAGGSAAFTHGGANEGFRAAFYAFATRGQGAVVMSNGDAGSQLATEILRAIAREYGWPAFRVRERATVAVDSAVLRELAGSYTITGSVATGLRIVIRPESDRLSASLPQYGTVELYPASASRFFMLEQEAEIAFQREAAGRVTGLVVTGLASEPVTARREPPAEPPGR